MWFSRLFKFIVKVISAGFAPHSSSVALSSFLCFAASFAASSIKRERQRTVRRDSVQCPCLHSGINKTKSELASGGQQG